MRRPPRGVERNIVVSWLNWGTERDGGPTTVGDLCTRLLPLRPVYVVSQPTDVLMVLDPLEHRVTNITVPSRREDRPRPGAVAYWAKKTSGSDLDRAASRWTPKAASSLADPRQHATARTRVSSAVAIISAEGASPDHDVRPQESSSDHRHLLRRTTIRSAATTFLLRPQNASGGSI